MHLPIAPRVYALLAFFLLGLNGCSSPGTADDSGQQQITLTGSSTIAPLMGEIAKRFEEQHPGFRVDVQTGGSSRGVADARSGMADIGMASRDLKPDEADLLAFPIARDGVCIILHAENPVSELTNQQVVDIYTGRIANWQDVGGPDAEITVVNKAEGRSTLELFLAHFGIESQAIEADVVIGDNEQGVKTVAGNPHAIGYVSIGTAEYDAATGVPIKLLPINGVPANSENVANGTFPLARTLHLVTKEKPTGKSQALIEFSQSEQVHDLVKELSFVSLQ